MKISFSLVQYNVNKTQNPVKNNVYHTDHITLPENFSKDTVSFTGVKVKKINIESEKQKLLKTITKILETDVEELSQEEVSSRNTLRALKFIESKNKKMEDLCSKARVINNVPFLNPTMQYEARRDIINEATRVQNSTYKGVKIKDAEISEAKWDYVLLNKFKSAIMNDNFDLASVFKSHYSQLAEITDLDEMENLFPKLNIPITPAEVISQNIVKGLTRNYYLKIADCYTNDDYESFSHLLTDALLGACTNYAANNPKLDLNELPLQLLEEFSTQVMEKYRKGVQQGSFSFIPEFVKKQSPIATPLDIALLNIDFDKFVIDVYKQQILDSKKLNEIVYTYGDAKFELRKLSNSPYKFDKVSEKIKKIIKDSLSLKNAQRDYDNFEIEELKSRLDFFANNPACEDDVIFESIMEFYISEFLPEDITNLKILLRELDSVIDKKKSVSEIISDIQHKKIRPIGTQKLNDAERKKAYDKIKAEQQKTYELLAKQDEFDNIINTLYSLQMNSVASLCSDFRPHSLEDKSNLERVNFLIDFVDKNFVNNKPINPNKFENDLFYWDVYHQYKSRTEFNHHEKFLELILNSEKSSKTNLEVDQIKAGQYIFLTEMISTYPESLSVADSPEVFEKIMEKTKGDNKKALGLLVKYDEYRNLAPELKSQILSVLDIFDVKDSIEKAIIKQILETEYLSNDTEISMIDTQNNETQIIKIASEAKQQIFDKYKFPSCLDLFEAFETAAKTFTSDYGTSGIKRIGTTNQALSYKTEIKIKGYPDRLFSENNDFRFDVYSERGLH